MDAVLRRFQNKNFLLALKLTPWNHQQSNHIKYSIQSTSGRQTRRKSKTMFQKDENSQLKEKLCGQQSDAKSSFRLWKPPKEEFTSTGQGLRFKLVSYNILAQDLLLEYAQLYYPCEPVYLKWSYRLAALAKEIVVQKPDILCLQEVQENHLVEIFEAFKGDLPLKLLFKKKTNNKSDGCAILYNENLFELVAHDIVEYFQPGIELLDRPNVAVIAKLRCKCQPEVNFLVCTTHLLYNPRREDVRLAQLMVLLAELDRHSVVKSQLSGELQRIPIFLTGDFNFTPQSAPYELLTTGKICYEQLALKTLTRMDNGEEMMPRTGKKFISYRLGITDNCQHMDCVKSNYEGCSSKLVHRTNNSSHAPETEFKPDLDLKLFSTGTLTHDLHLKSVYNHCSPRSFGSTFQGEWVTVDHLFYSNPPKCSQGSAKLLSTYELPTVEDCEKIGFLPNRELGSDHLMLAARFLFNFSDKKES